MRGFCSCSFVITLPRDTWVETDAYELLINTPMILTGYAEAWEIPEKRNNSVMIQNARLKSPTEEKATSSLAKQSSEDSCGSYAVGVEGQLNIILSAVHGPSRVLSG